MNLFNNGFALLIGVNEQAQQQQARPLPYAEKDVMAIGAVLKSERCGYDPNNIITLLSKEANKNKIEQELNKMVSGETFQQNTDATVIIYFSGHGYFKEDEKSFFLAPYDFNINNLEETAIKKSFFDELIMNIKAKNLLLILDCCHAAGSDVTEIQTPNSLSIPPPNSDFFSKKISDPKVSTGSADGSKPIGNTYAILYSSRGDELSYIHKEKDMSIFTYHLVEALKGEGQILPDGATINVLSLASYLQNSVPHTTQILFPRQSQTPVFDYRGAGFPIALMRGGEGVIPGLLRIGSKDYFNKMVGKDGRFAHLKENLTNANSSKDKTIGLGNDTILTAIKDQTNEAIIRPEGESLQRDWEGKNSGIILLGNEGMGKTITMLRIWQDIIQKEKDAIIPIYIPLSAYNQRESKEQQKFISNYIVKNYALAENISDDDPTVLLETWIKTKKTGVPKPKILLLLDGLNEISSDITSLLTALNDLWANDNIQSNIQIIVSGRYKSNHAFSDDFKVWELQPLGENAITDYLVHKEKIEKRTVATFQDNEIMPLLRNPMMLRLFSDVQQENAINRTGELLDSFIENKLIRFNQDKPKGKKVLAHFQMHYLLPFVAWEMEKSGVSEIKGTQLEAIINDAFAKFHQADFFKGSHPKRAYIKDYRKHIKVLQLGELPLVEKINRFEDLIVDLNHELFPITLEGNTLRFLHQSFLEYFAAKYLHNEIFLSLEKGMLSPTLKTQKLSPPIRRMLGEITKEHYNIPAFIPAGKTWAHYYKKTCLGHMLELCRGVFDPEDVGFVVWNIVSIWSEVRGELSGADLSDLHLGNLNFNGIVCSCFDTAPTTKVIWTNSFLSPKQWFPQNHEGDITKILISPDGKYLASASKDQTVKLWSTVNNQYIRTLTGHKGTVQSISFSPDSKRLLSGGADHKIFEWEIETGRCLWVYRGHTDQVNTVSYHQEGNKFLSASKDGTVKEWSSEKKQCIHNFKFKENTNVKSVHYMDNGHSFLAAVIPARGNHYYTEWSIQKAVEITKYKPGDKEAKKIHAITMHPFAEKFCAIVSENRNVANWKFQEWDIISQLKLWEIDSFLEVSKDRKDQFIEAIYSPDGQHFLVAGINRNIYEWPVQKPQNPYDCIKTQVFQCPSSQATTLAYHPTEKAFFAGHAGGTIKKWCTLSGQVLHTFQAQKTAMLDIKLVNGLDFSQVQWTAPLSDEEWDAFLANGAILSKEI